MSHTVTAADFITREDSGDLYYTGPLEEAKAFIRREFAVTVTQEKGKYLVLLGSENPVTWETCNDWGKGNTEEEAWRYALAAEFGTEESHFEPFDLGDEPKWSENEPRYYWDNPIQGDDPNEPFGVRTARIIDLEAGGVILYCHEANADAFVKMFNAHASE